MRDWVVMGGWGRDAGGREVEFFYPHLGRVCAVQGGDGVTHRRHNIIFSLSDDIRLIIIINNNY